MENGCYTGEVIDEARAARQIVSLGWVTEAQMKDALYERVMNAASPPLLAVLVDRGWLTPERAKEVEGAFRSTQGSSGDPSGETPRDDVEKAAADPKNRYGHLVRLECVGHGGMATVWRAWDTRLRRSVALKFVSESHRHLLKEARAAARLDHPNIVPVYEILGEESAEPVLVLKYVEGGTLLQRVGQMSFLQAAEILSDVARAVQFAHDAGILHHDLKPANILLEASGRPVVTDFGLARDLSREAARRTPLIGTPSYMAPEQLSEPPPPPSRALDIYALGATLYHVVTGRPPYSGSSPGQILNQLRAGPPPAPTSMNPSVPRDLEFIILRAMERDPLRRYRSALRIARDLERFLRREPVLGEGEEAFAEAVSLLETGRLKPALSRMREALALPWTGGDPAACMLKQLDEEISTVTLALQGNPRYVAGMRHRACLRIACVLLQGMNGKPETGLLRDSLADLDRAVDLQPHDPELPLVRAMAVILGAQIAKEDAPQDRLAAALRDLDGVLARVDSLPARHTRGIALLLLARQEHARGRDARELYARSIQELEDVHRRTPEDADVIEDLAAAYRGRAKRQLADPKMDAERAAELQKMIKTARAPAPPPSASPPRA